MTYHFRPLGKNCHKTGKPLAPGGVCYSILQWEDGQMVRHDYSPEGWEGPPEGMIGCWQTRVPDRDPALNRPIDPDAMMTYLERLCEEDMPSTEQTRYLLALSLLQKRRLEIEETRQDGEIQYLRLIGSKSEGPFEVRDFQMAEEEIHQLQQELNRHFAEAE